VGVDIDRHLDHAVWDALVAQGNKAGFGVGRDRKRRALQPKGWAMSVTALVEATADDEAAPTATK
jgi:hypothetical protein